MADDLLPKVGDYEGFLKDIKDRIQGARIRAALAVNQELVLLYWQIGKDILGRQQDQGWGTKVIDRLAHDLRVAFPEMKGFSSRNLKYMRAFAQAWPESEFVQQVVAQIPWGHNVRILDYVKDSSEREWYVRRAVEHGWSRNVLVCQIESRLFERQGCAISNFDVVLPAPQSELAQQILKDPYNFDFLSLGNDYTERDLQKALLLHVRSFLLELGAGFALVGSEYHLEVGNQDFYLDLLFYHLHLRCYVVVELKIGAFQPEYAGKMNFYLSAVDDILRHAYDQPSIGIILCKNREKIVVEYALRDIGKPIGIAEFELTASLPDELKGSLPSVEAIEEEFGRYKEDKDMKE